jgi:diguanylate cyclase (GGDEF)-like protein
MTMNADPAALPTANSAERRQFVFISGGQLQETPCVRQLMRFVEPVQSDDTAQEILDSFLADSAIYALPVVDADGRAVALVDRKGHVEFFGKPYTREIFGRRSILSLLAHKDYAAGEPIVVEDDCSIDDVAQIIIEAGMQHMVTGFLVSSQGLYRGVANGHDLLNMITQRKQAELHHLANYDSLTGMPNRMLLGDRLEHACNDAKRTGRLVALLFVDVDRFKHINDSLGHSAGDAVLRKVVERLTASARRTDTVARLGGDEFVVLMEDFSAPVDVDMVAERLVNAMREPIELLGHSLVVTVSIGSAIFPNDDTEISPLLAKADAAMYAAKAGGRDRFCRYSADTPMYDPTRLSLKSDLRRAIEGDELLLHYQPQIDLATQDICGVEALVRWRHPLRGLVAPAAFIPVAEESGLIVQLGEWVLREALRQLGEWQRLGLPSLRVAINISALQFRDSNLPGLLAEQMAAFSIDPDQIELELTESVLMQNVDAVLETLQAIKRLGVHLAIDDFGTGFSSLSYLRRFPIDRLKIDQSFVRDIESTPINASIARAIVALANSLSLGIVAEGIETPAQQTLLEKMGCTEGQGYFIARPMSGDAIPPWVCAHRQRRFGNLEQEPMISAA